MGIGELVRSLGSYEEIIGVDVDEGLLRFARKRHGGDDIRFAVMDAEDLDLESAAFDTVHIARSLHHLRDPARCLEEMARVLKPGGRLLVREMHADADSEPALTAVLIHQWIADVDRANGAVHRPTYARDEIMRLVNRLGFAHVTTFDRPATCPDPLSAKTIARYETVIDRVLADAHRTNGASELVKRGEALRNRLHSVGVATQEPLLVAIGVK